MAGRVRFVEVLRNWSCVRLYIEVARSAISVESNVNLMAVAWIAENDDDVPKLNYLPINLLITL